MKPTNALITVIALLLLGGLGWMLFGSGDATSVAAWNENDVVPVTEEGTTADDQQADPGEFGGVERAEVGGSDGADLAPRARPLITIKGRVVNKREAPVAGAKVNLSAQGRGRRSRITKEVVTQRDGTFAFAGKGFPRMWVTLEVTHGDYARASAFKPFNDAKGELDMGDIKVVVGGTIIGSVTDMQGNIVADAEANLSPLDRGRGRWGRGRGNANPVVKADRNGVFRIEHVTPGRYRVNATAPHRQRRSDGPITVVDEGEERLDPIQLGPGFELTGVVFKPDGKPLEGADVNIRGSDRRNRERGKRTNKQGEFAFDHLPPGEYAVQVRADGFLTNEDYKGIKVTESAPLAITMQAGLTIEGIVVDAATSRPVTKYGARVQRIGSLPDPEEDKRREASRKLFEEFRALRGQGGELTADQRKKLEDLGRRMRELGGRGAFGGFGRGGFGRGGRDGGGRGGRNSGGTGGRGARDAVVRSGRDSGRGRGGRDSGRGRGGGRGGRGGFGGFGGFGRRNANLPGDTGEADNHPDGAFRFSGLEEGIYVVDIGSPDHQKIRSAQIELRKGVEPPKLQISVQHGILVAGRVIAKSNGAPVRNANIELRLVLEDDGQNNPPGAANDRGGPGGRGRTGGRGGRGGRGGLDGNMFRQFFGNGPRTTSILNARTKADGTFEIRNAPPGKYLLRTEADGYSRDSSKQFELGADETGFEIKLGELGILFGRVVAGVSKDKLSEVRVMAYSQPRTFRDASVTEDGTYEIRGLEPGDYIVRAFVGDARRYIFRQMFRGMGGQDPNNAAPTVDVKIKEGGRHQFNVSVTQNASGSVKGRVMLNGRGAVGYRVSLRKLDGNSGNERGGRRGFRFGNSATVDANGDYEIREVEMGQYALSVSSSGGRGGRGPRGRGPGGRGFGGGAQVSRMTIFVNAETATHAPQISLEIGSLAGTVTVPPEVKDAKEKPQPLRGGRVTLYKGVTEVPDPSQPGSEDVLRFSARVRDDKFEFKELPTGEYLLQARFGGREITTQTLYVGAGEKTSITVTAGKTRKPDPAGTNRPGGTNRGARRGARRGANGQTDPGGNRRANRGARNRGGSGGRGPGR